jgi:hypothetical protein
MKEYVVSTAWFQQPLTLRRKFIIYKDADVTWLKKDVGVSGDFCGWFLFAQNRCRIQWLRFGCFNVHLLHCRQACCAILYQVAAASRKLLRFVYGVVCDLAGYQADLYGSKYSEWCWNFRIQALLCAHYNLYEEASWSTNGFYATKTRWIAGDVVAAYTDLVHLTYDSWMELATVLARLDIQLTYILQ